MEIDVILNKTQIIERCLKRIREEYNQDPLNLEDYTKQDSIILNIQRSCQAAIDLAMYLVSEYKLGIPQSSREAFDLLVENGFLSTELGKKLKAMVGFRNIAVHDYQAVNLKIVQEVVENHLSDLEDFIKLILLNA